MKVMFNLKNNPIAPTLIIFLLLYLKIINPALSKDFKSDYRLQIYYTITEKEDDLCNAAIHMVLFKNKRAITIQRDQYCSLSEIHQKSQVKEYSIGTHFSYTLKITDDKVKFKERFNFESGEQGTEEFEVKLRIKNGKIKGWGCKVKKYKATINSKVIKPGSHPDCQLTIHNP